MEPTKSFFISKEIRVNTQLRQFPCVLSLCIHFLANANYYVQ